MIYSTFSFCTPFSMSTKILSSTFVVSSPTYAQCPVSDIPEYVFVGRSNVGKSSLINALCQKKEFAKTWPKPGKTQLINYFAIESKDDEGDIQHWHLVDLPGYGYAKVSRELSHAWEDVMLEYMLKRKNIRNIFVLIDSKLPPQWPDLACINRLNEQQRPFSIVFTKTDKINQKDLAHNVKAFMAELATMMTQVPKHFLTSAEKNWSTHLLLEEIHQWNKATKK